MIFTLGNGEETDVDADDDARNEKHQKAAFPNKHFF